MTTGNRITPSEIEEALDLTFEGNGEAVDVSKTLRFNNTAAGGATKGAKTPTKSTAKTSAPPPAETTKKQTASGEIEYDPKEFTITKRGILKKYKGKNTVVAIPDGVKKIGESAFEEKNITTVTIPNGVTTIESFAFMSCEKLESVAIPDSVEEIGTWAFAKCSSLERINIPAKTKIIGSFVDNCSIMEL